MHTAPAVSVQIDAEPRWRLALAALSLLSPLTAAAWWAHRTLNSATSWIPASIGAALFLFALTAWAARQSWRLRTPDCLSIQWSGAEWTLIDRSCRASTGDLAVVIDLGHWMLLRFDHPPNTRPALRRRIWIPVSEPLVRQHWHALRCAVHGARPADHGGRNHER